MREGGGEGGGGHCAFSLFFFFFFERFGKALVFSLMMDGDDDEKKKKKPSQAGRHIELKYPRNEGNKKDFDSYIGSKYKKAGMNTTHKKFESNDLLEFYADILV